MAWLPWLPALMPQAGALVTRERCVNRGGGAVPRSVEYFCQEEAVAGVASLLFVRKTQRRPVASLMHHPQDHDIRSNPTVEDKMPSGSQRSRARHEGGPVLPGLRCVHCARETLEYPGCIGFCPGRSPSCV